MEIEEEEEEVIIISRNNNNNNKKKKKKKEALPLISMNHISLVVRCVWTSVRFYEEVLGFLLVKRPSSFNFPGAWLYNYGVGIHLLENQESVDLVQEPPPPLRPINPKDNHMSFQCRDVNVVKRRLEELGIMKYVTATVEDKEGKIKVDQVFFHDPDGYMIEICNCDNFPLIPISSNSTSSSYYCFKNNKKTVAAATPKCGGGIESIMERLRLDLMNFSF